MASRPQSSKRQRHAHRNGLPALVPLAQELAGLYDEMLRHEAAHSAALHAVRDSHSASARNLLHYVALRRRDIRVLQERLAAL